MDDFAPTLDPVTSQTADDCAELALTLRAQSGVHDTLLMIGQQIQAATGGAERCSVTLQLPDGRRAGQAHSDDMAARAYDIIAKATPHAATDRTWPGGNATLATLTDYRFQWPGLIDQLLSDTSIRGLMSLDLPLAGDRVGSVLLYSDQPGVLPELLPSTVPSVLILSALAAEAAVDREKVEHLNRALDSNRTIGTALGILMSTRRLTYDQAFDLLRATSQNGHRKLRDVADDVVYAGDLPTPNRP